MATISFSVHATASAVRLCEPLRLLCPGNQLGLLLCPCDRLELLIFPTLLAVLDPFEVVTWLEALGEGRWSRWQRGVEGRREEGGRETD